MLIIRIFLKPILQYTYTMFMATPILIYLSFLSFGSLLVIPSSTYNL